MSYKSKNQIVYTHYNKEENYTTQKLSKFCYNYDLDHGKAVYIKINKTKRVAKSINEYPDLFLQNNKRIIDFIEDDNSIDRITFNLYKIDNYEYFKIERDTINRRLYITPLVIPDFELYYSYSYYYRDNLRFGYNKKYKCKCCDEDITCPEVERDIVGKPLCDFKQGSDENIYYINDCCDSAFHKKCYDKNDNKDKCGCCDANLEYNELYL